MLGAIFSSYLAVTIIFCFLRIRIGIAMFLFYAVLVQKVKFFSFGPNLFVFLILVALLFNYKYKTLVFKPLAPFIFLYLAQFFMIPFHNSVPYEIQVNAFRVDFMSTIILPFAMINVANRNINALNLFNKVLMSTVIVAVIYSLFLTTMPGNNPYITLLNSFIQGSVRDYSSYYAAENSGRLFGRISGVFFHPMQNGLFLSLSLLFLLSKIEFDRVLKDPSLIVLTFSTLLAILCIGVRTSIAAIGLGLAVFLILERRMKVFFIAIFSVAILLIIIQQMPGMEEYITSIFGKHSGEVKGSSLEMRLIQLSGCLQEIRHNYLCGNGYNWTSYYAHLYGRHPIMLAFESLVFVVLCNNGIFGGAIWILMILMYSIKIFQNFHNKHYKNSMITLMIVYLAYSIVTGEYGYMKYFLIFYAVMWANGIQRDKLKHSCK